MRLRIPTPAGRVSLFTLALVGAAQAVAWLVRSRKTRYREPIEYEPLMFYRCF